LFLSSDNTKNVETKNLQKSEINKRKSFFPLFFLFFVILLFLSVERIIIGVTPPQQVEQCVVGIERKGRNKLNANRTKLCIPGNGSATEIS